MPRRLAQVVLVAAALHPGSPLLADAAREARPAAPASVVDARGKVVKPPPAKAGAGTGREKPKADSTAPKTPPPPPDEKNSGLGCAE